MEETAQQNEKLSNAKIQRWFKPLIQALRDLGGSATPKKACSKIIENEQVSDEEVNEVFGKNNGNKFKYEVTWARYNLALTGYISREKRGIWALTETGKTIDMTEELALSIVKTVKELKSRENTGAAIGDDEIDTIHYWIYAPGENACMWEEFYSQGIMAIGWGEIGDLQGFATKEEMKDALKETFDSNSSYKNSAHATWQFAYDMKPGDIIFVKKGMDKLVGRGIVTSEYEYDSNREDEFKNIRRVKWTTQKNKWVPNPFSPTKGQLTEVTSFIDEVKKVEASFEDEKGGIEEPDKKTIKYTQKEFLDEVYMYESEYLRLVTILERKKNIILQGAPGVGKTFIAKRLAYSIIGYKDPEKVSMIQFHQSYSYEDFIMGWRPSGAGFEPKAGVFYTFCKKAETDSDNNYYFIIDEINRGNLSKIFGELFMLIENDKRGIPLQLLYKEETFSIPENVYIIGLMNTADRSLAMVDYALRRRFAFIDIKPGFKTKGFLDYTRSLDNKKFDTLIDCVEKLNDDIAKDESLGEGFCIGHSYFCDLDKEPLDDQVLNGIVEYELIPLLKEYWFDEPTKVKTWSDSLRSAIQ